MPIDMKKYSQAWSGSSKLGKDDVCVWELTAYYQNPITPVYGQVLKFHLISLIPGKRIGVIELNMSSGKKQSIIMLLAIS